MKSTGRTRSTGSSRRAVVAIGGLIAAFVLSGSIGLGAVPAASAATDDTQLTVAVSPDNGGILSPGQDLNVAVSVTNQGSATVVGGTVDLWMDESPIATRKALTTWLGSTASASDTVTIGTGPIATLPPGSTSLVRVTVPAAAVPIAGSRIGGVFGIGSTASVEGGVHANGHSTIVWNSGSEVQRSNISVVMPITTPSTANGLISAVDLATYTAPNGVLTRQLDGLTGHSTVAVGIDPMIIASIRALGTAAPASASQWLLSLSELPNDVFSLGFGDADLAAQFQSGLQTPLQPTALGYALDPANFAAPQSQVGETEGFTPSVTTPAPTPTTPPGPVLPTLDQLVAWPYSLHGIAFAADDSVRADNLPSYVASGFSTTILSGDNSNADDLPSTPNAPLPITGGTVVVSDAGISDALREAATAPSDTVWNEAMSRVNAQLGLVSETSTSQRDLLVTFGRTWPSSGTQLERTLRSVLTSPWSNPITFPEVVTSTPTSGLSVKDAGENQTRLADVKRLFAMEQRLDDFSSILDDPTTLSGRTRAELLTLLAVSWTQPHNDWDAAVATSIQSSLKTLESVTILPTENVNLVSNQGSIPFTVSNALPGEAANVVLNAAPSNSRLEIDDDATKRVLADSRATVLVPVKAKLGNGQVILTLQLFSKTGVKIGQPTSVTVDVHADWEGIGALIVGILLVLLFGFGIVRNILRRRHERRTDASAESGDDEAEGKDDGQLTAGEDASADPGDPADDPGDLDDSDTPDAPADPGDPGDPGDPRV